LYSDILLYYIIIHLNPFSSFTDRMDKMALLKIERIERNNDEMSEIMSLSEYIRTKLSMNEVNDLLQKKEDVVNAT